MTGTNHTPEQVSGDGPGHELSKDCACIPHVNIEIDQETGEAVEHIIHNAWTDKYRDAARRDNHD